jgi:hypothetical protein
MFGRTPIHFASTFGHVDVVTTLLKEFGADCRPQTVSAACVLGYLASRRWGAPPSVCKWSCPHVVAPSWMAEHPCISPAARTLLKLYLKLVRTQTNPMYVTNHCSSCKVLLGSAIVKCGLYGVVSRPGYRKDTPAPRKPWWSCRCCEHPAGPWSTCERLRRKSSFPLVTFEAHHVWTLVEKRGMWFPAAPTSTVDLCVVICRLSCFIAFLLPVDVYVSKTKDQTPLHIAASEDIVKALVDAGADVNKVDVRDADVSPGPSWLRAWRWAVVVFACQASGRTPLHCASLGARGDVVSAMLKRKAHVDSCDVSHA